MMMLAIAAQLLSVTSARRHAKLSVRPYVNANCKGVPSSHDFSIKENCCQDVHLQSVWLGPYKHKYRNEWMHDPKSKCSVKFFKQHGCIGPSQEINHIQSFFTECANPFDHMAMASILFECRPVKGIKHEPATKPRYEMREFALTETRPIDVLTMTAVGQTSVQPSFTEQVYNMRDWEPVPMAERDLALAHTTTLVPNVYNHLQPVCVSCWLDDSGDWGCKGEESAGVNCQGMTAAASVVTNAPKPLTKRTDTNCVYITNPFTTSTSNCAEFISHSIGKDSGLIEIKGPMTKCVNGRDPTLTGIALAVASATTAA